ncbi:hypothetical protein A7E78_01520 [Syntrophotalea acetylenivorans]|uniref:Uncharacterized protein n=1 Tax=Syntrophotalea acetylenivorans TaxID=1842532 RepID=A0A1L3GL57_9BACT|nr:lysylphosphatidylglycerol synthase transmembrane domain-containing protein [Syntrophotalea acetylenivorans]APG26654.1 hypothetical protein A7E78_01520 [Syntrophotalea acetylenivorans]
MNKVNKKNINYYSVFRLLIIILIAFFAIFGVDYGALIDHLTARLLAAMVLSQVVVLLSLTLLSFRLSLFIDKKNPPVIASFKAIVLAMGFNLIIPGRMSEFVKPLFLKSKVGISMEGGLSSVFLERVTDMFIISLLSSVVLSGSFVDFDGRIMICAASVCFLLLHFLPKGMPWVEKGVAFIPFKRLSSLILNILEHLSQAIIDKRLYGGFACGCLAWCFTVSSFFVFFFVAENGQFSIDKCLILFVISTIAYAVPALPGGVGTYEASIVFVLQHYGYSMEHSLVLAAALHLSQMLMVGLLAGVVVVREDLTLGDFFGRAKAVPSRG